MIQKCRSFLLFAHPFHTSSPQNESSMPENIYHPEFVKALFNKMSSSYERMNFITSFGFSIRWRKQFLRYLHSNGQNIEIIDLLTGMGETWEDFVQKYPYFVSPCLLLHWHFIKKSLNYFVLHTQNLNRTFSVYQYVIKTVTILSKRL